jgi:hypothetical protein
MNSPLPEPAPAQRRDWTHRLVNLLVAVVVIAVAAAAFVFSYAGVHAIALLGGVSAQLARYYPGLFDAVLVIACVAAITLRDGRWWARLWAWLVIIVLLAAIGTTDVLHAMNYTLRHRTTEGIVAAAPVVAVLLAFSLLLTMLRRPRTPAGRPAGPAPLDVPALPAAVAAPPIALPAAPAARATAPAARATVPAEQRAVSAELADTVLMPAVALEGEAVPMAVPAAQDSPVPGVAPTRADPVVADAQEASGAAAPIPEHQATEPYEVIAPAAPVPDPTTRRDDPAPPTVQVPALAAEPAAAAAPVRGRQNIRYAGNGVPGTARKPQPAERDASSDPGYWDAGQFAGLVYPAREAPADLDDTADDTAGDAGTDDGNDAKTGGPAPRENPPELDDDAPPFATAPFAPVPGLNRVRSTPTPPADDEDDEDE